MLTTFETWLRVKLCVRLTLPSGASQRRKKTGTGTLSSHAKNRGTGPSEKSGKRTLSSGTQLPPEEICCDLWRKEGLSQPGVGDR